ncbi:hypothetical protein, partial [Ruthenibacterium lactatiformans]|uniref:hypothetical protein n=1 Tax=Ruthenibacterium lactatiformans TaxID=1550024 RepID=UPI0039A2601C
MQNIVEKQKRHPNRDTVPVVRCKGFCSRLRVCRPCGVAAAAPHPKNVPPARFLHGLVPFGFESLAAHKNDFFPKNKNGIPTGIPFLWCAAR